MILSLSEVQGENTEQSERELTNQFTVSIEVVFGEDGASLELYVTEFGEYPLTTRWSKKDADRVRIEIANPAENG